jgi:hypothetical protein
MATKTKAAVRAGYGKGGRRPPVKVKKRGDFPLLPVVVGAILVVFAIGVIIYAVANNKPAPGPQTAGGIPCDQLEHTQVHYHAALQIIYQGNVTHLPDNLGIVADSAGNVSCFYWLHVHAANKDTIHIESPASQTFTLGQFFSVWSAWSKLNNGPSVALDATHVATFTVTPDESLVVYIDKQDGKGPQPFTGNPSAIVLASHEVITIEITPPAVTPPPSFTFASGL